MRVHHLASAALRVPGAPVVTHVLLLETDRSLALVDSGFGLADLADARRRIGPLRAVMRPELDPARTVVRQVAALGFDPRDVRHVVLTHADLDHAGGVADFPWATVHLTAAEAGAVGGPSWFERRRYRTGQWAHGPAVVGHEPGGETWHGFGGVRPLDAVGEGILLVPMPGHTRGHAGVAVRAGDRWLVHAGDAVNHTGYLTGETVPRLFRAHQRFVAHDPRQVRATHRRLLALREAPDVDVVCAHDRVLLERYLVSPAPAPRAGSVPPGG